jgi:pimeloyl-ACP methyl ester carboxylesterase
MLMAGLNRTHVSDLRGAVRMVVDASAGIAGLVENMHRTIQKRRGPLGAPTTEATRGITGFVYRSVSGGLRLVGRGIDLGLAPVVALLPEGERTPVRDAYLSAINGVYGDYLARTGNPLALEMVLRHRGRLVDPANPALALAEAAGGAPTRKLLVLVHGLCLNDLQWTREGHNHGEALASELGYTPLYLRYNSGLRVSDNGRSLADLLETLLASWPQPVEELVIIGHSMGGLVARSAVHHARQSRRTWPKRLTKMVFLGTPHHGAPLERGGQRLDFVMELSPYSAPFTRLGRQRSAGITSLRHGTVTDGAHRFVPLPAGVKCYAAAATLGSKRDLLAERLVGDGLVPLDSALGRHKDPTQTLAFPRHRQWVGHGMGHLELLNRAEVYAQLHEWLRSAD